MSNFRDLFKDLVKRYSEMDIKYPHLKAITIAQWALESGRGSSKLATEHLNFGGLKWRKEMQGYAEIVWYSAHHGGDFYCIFSKLEEFINDKRLG